MRRAISKAINRPAIAERVMEKLAIPAANLVSPGVFGHNPELKPEPYDPDGAKKLLAEAGYPDGFSVTLAAPNNRYINDEQVAQAVAQMLTRVGIATKVEAMPLRRVPGPGPEGGVRPRPARLGLVRGRPRAALAHRRTQPGQGLRRVELGALPERRSSTASSTRRSPRSTARSARRWRARPPRSSRARPRLIPLYHQYVTWAMKKHLTYAARTDEFTLAHHFRPRYATVT